MKNNQIYDFIGKGIYSVSEVSRLTKIHPRRIRRWVRGYTYQNKGEQFYSKPKLLLKINQIDNSIALSFLDLMEIRFIDYFLKNGVSWHSLKIATSKARELVNHSHPFSTKKFKTDGETIFTEIATKEGNSELLDIINDQYRFKKILDPYLYEGLDYIDEKNVGRWWPYGKDYMIVIDPARSFGQPIIAKEGVPTAILADAYRIEKSIKKVALWYEVEENAVKNAIDFERKIVA